VRGALFFLKDLEWISIVIQEDFFFTSDYKTFFVSELSNVVLTDPGSFHSRCILLNEAGFYGFFLKKE